MVASNSLPDPDIDGLLGFIAERAAVQIVTDADFAADRQKFVRDMIDVEVHLLHRHLRSEANAEDAARAIWRFRHLLASEIDARDRINAAVARAAEAQAHQ